MNVREIKEIVRQYHLAISPRRMGQNFLVDPRALARIAAVVGAGQEDEVLEIGAGLGALTQQLLQSGARLTAVEKDPRFVQVLSDRFKGAGNLKIVKSDILRLDLSEYAGGKHKSLLLIGNIPFSMTSPILEFLLKHRHWIRRAVLTVQKEVAQRIVAQPGTKAYSSITLLVQVAFVPSIAFMIHPGAFYPQPEVTSAVLRLEPLSEPAVAPEEEEEVLKLVRLIFTHRRKTLLNALSIPRDDLSRQQLRQCLEAAHIDPTRRPETLVLHEVVRLHRLLSPR